MGRPGAAIVAALRAARKFKLGGGTRVVVIFPDSIRNYLSKFVQDDWMVDHGFMTGSDVKRDIFTEGARSVDPARLPKAVG